MIYVILGFLIGISPFGYFMFNAHHDQCGLQGEQWIQCREHQDHES